MKIAIVHDDLIQFGGAERLLLALHEIWPDAPIYTLVASKKWKKVCRDQKIDLRTSFMDKLPLVEKLNRYYAPFLFHLFGIESFDLTEYDVVLTSSSRYAHGVLTKPGTTHICYMNSPGRMFWEPGGYFAGEEYGFLSKIKVLAKPFLSIPLSHIRRWDYIAAQKVDKFIANSTTSAARIKKYYRRSPSIIYPYVDFDIFSKGTPTAGNYYLVLTRLAPWKKVEIAVEACTKLNLPLKVIGEGPNLTHLKGIAGNNVEFLGYVTDQKRKELLLGCKALINTQKEDFGIVPLEAMASGKPVIAYGAGGVLETVIPGKTGEFFYEQTAESLGKLLKVFNPQRYDLYICRKQANLFNKERFIRDMRAFIRDNSP